MSDYQDKAQDMVETADALEAVAVFRSWKNLFLCILIFSLVLIQAIFWLMDTQRVVPERDRPTMPSTVTPAQEPNITAAAQALTAEPNQAVQPESSVNRTSSLADLDGLRLGHVLRIVNGIAILVGMMYCAILLCSINLTVVGRLGGVQHISRAFFLSLVVLILLIPWQTLFDTMTLGVLFSARDIMDGRPVKNEGLYPAILYYLRFCGYWLAVFGLTVMSQIRCARWSKSMLRRMEMI